MKKIYEKKVKELENEVLEILNSDDIDFDLLEKKELQMKTLQSRLESYDNKKTEIISEIKENKEEEIEDTQYIFWSDEDVIDYVESKGYYYVAESKGGVIYTKKKDEWVVMNIKPVQELFKKTTIDVKKFDNRKKNGEQETITKENIITEYVKRKTPYNGTVCEFNTYYGNALNIAPKIEIESKKGNIKPYLDLIDIMFKNEDEKVKESFLDFIADIFQNPNRRPLVSWTLRGDMGSYKNFIMKLIEDILNDAVYKTSNIGSLLNDGFNSYLEGKLLIVADEVLWGGDKKMEGSMKDFITKDVIWIERKGYERYKRNFVARLFMTSNSDFTNSATLDERRSNVLTINTNLSMKKRKDNPNSEESIVANNFEKWVKEDKNIKESLYYYFLNRKINDNNMIEIVRTNELKNQKKLYMGTFYNWIKESIDNENFVNIYDGDNEYKVSKNNIKISTRVLKQSYSNFIKENEIKYNILNGLELVKKFEEIFNKIDLKRKTISLNGKKFNGYNINYSFEELQEILEEIFN
jgi:hypothetical protein